MINHQGSNEEWHWDSPPARCLVVLDPLTAQGPLHGVGNLARHVTKHLGLAVAVLDQTCDPSVKSRLLEAGVDPAAMEGDVDEALQSADMCICFSRHAGRAQVSSLYRGSVPLTVSLDMETCSGGSVKAGIRPG